MILNYKAILSNPVFKSPTLGNECWDFSLPQKNKCFRKHQAKWSRMWIQTKDVDHPDSLFISNQEKSVMFLWDEFNGDYLSGLGREGKKGDPQRVWPYHMTSA